MDQREGGGGLKGGKEGRGWVKGRKGGEGGARMGKSAVGEVRGKEDSLDGNSKIADQVKCVYAIQCTYLHCLLSVFLHLYSLLSYLHPARLRGSPGTADHDPCLPPFLSQLKKNEDKRPDTKP